MEMALAAGPRLPAVCYAAFTAARIPCYDPGRGRRARGAPWPRFTMLSWNVHRTFTVRVVESTIHSEMG